MSTPERMGIDSGRRNRIPRPLTEDERARLDEFLDGIHYSTRYECCKR
jgi:cyclin-dependent kinase regulatory subunit CKS1